MEKEYKIVLVGVALNIILPMLLRPFATKEEAMPENGAASLSYKGQFMHMMVHHNQVPFMSSVIVAIIIYASMFVENLI